MSQNIALVAAEMWDPLFETQLQNTEYLKDTVRVFASVVGNTYNRRLGSFGELAAVGYNASNIPVSQVNYSQTPISLFPYAYKTVVSEREMTLVDGVPAANIMQEEAMTHALALGRYQDYLKLNSILSNTSPYVQIALATGYGTGFNTDKVIAARSQLEFAGIAMPEMFFALSADLQPALAKDPQYSSWFFNAARPLTDNVARPPTPTISYYGSEGRVLGGVGINSLPYTLASVNKQYLVPFWGKDVITCAMSTLGPKTTVWYNPGELRYEFTTQLIMGVGVTQANGVVLINADTANTLNT